MELELERKARALARERADGRRGRGAERVQTDEEAHGIGWGARLGAAERGLAGPFDADFYWQILAEVLDRPPTGDELVAAMRGGEEWSHPH